MPSSRSMRRPLFDVWPALDNSLPVALLGDLPTPVQPLDELGRTVGLTPGTLWVKRDDFTSPVYGGNKVRTLEVLFGAARSGGATHIWSTGAYGSNHAVATVLHAPRAGLAPGVLLFPQPMSWAALENLRVSLTAQPSVRALPHWSALPYGMIATRFSERRLGHRSVIMVPGGATPLGALGYVSAALELAEQVARGELPLPRTVVIGVGSTCTSAGLLVGFEHAARLGIGFVDAAGRPAPPILESVRVTPWPVTAHARIVSLAVRTARLLTALVGDASLSIDRRTLASRLNVTGSELGRGYGFATQSGRATIELFRAAHAFELDTTYSAKAAAGAIALARRGKGAPFLFWSTKSTAPLPDVDPARLANAPPRMLAWIRKAETELAGRRELPAGYRPLGESQRNGGAT